MHWIAIESLTQENQCSEEAEHGLGKYYRAQRCNEYLIIYTKQISSIRQAEKRLALQPQPLITQVGYNRLPLHLLCLAGNQGILYP